MGRTRKTEVKSEDKLPVAKKKVQVRFGQDTLEWKKLYKLMKTGRVDSNLPPKDIRTAYLKDFGKYTPNQFRSQFNNIKTILGKTRENMSLGNNYRIGCTNSNDFPSVDAVNPGKGKGKAKAKVSMPPIRDDDGNLGIDSEAEEASEDDGDDEDGGMLECVSLTQPNGAFGGRTYWSPHKICCEYENDDGVKCAVLLVCLTSGSLIDDDLTSVEVGVTVDGRVIKISEQINTEALDTDILYTKFPQRSDESQADFQLRYFAMKAAISNLISIGSTNQVYSIDAPFRVEPSEMTINYLGTPNGGRLLHIDIMETRKEKQKKLTILGGKASRGDHVAPASTKNQYSKNW